MLPKRSATPLFQEFSTDIAQVILAYLPSNQLFELQNTPSDDREYDVIKRDVNSTLRKRKQLTDLPEKALDKISGYLLTGEHSLFRATSRDFHGSFDFPGYRYVYANQLSNKPIELARLAYYFASSIAAPKPSTIENEAIRFLLAVGIIAGGVVGAAGFSIGFFAGSARDLTRKHNIRPYDDEPKLKKIKP